MEEVLIDDVARDQALGLDREPIARFGGARRSLDSAERSGQPAQAVDTELHRLDEALLLLPKRPRRVERARVGHDLRLLLPEPFELRPEVCELDPRRRQEVVEVLADLGRLGGGAADRLHVVLVLRLLLVATAVVDRQDEHGRKQDRARDQQPEPEERRVRPSGRPGRHLAPPAWRRAFATAFASLDSRRFVEEVELDICLGIWVLALEHDREMGAEERRSLAPCPEIAGVCSRKAKEPEPWSMPSLSITIISSSGDSDPCGRSAAEVQARSGSYGTNGPHATSRSRSSPEKARPGRGQSGRWRPRPGFATRAAYAHSRSSATTTTSTSPTSTSPGRRSGSACEAASSTTPPRSRSAPRSSTRSPTHTGRRFSTGT